MGSRVIAPLIVAVSVLLGCSNPLTVEDLAGTYSLTRMDARPLPQLLTATVDCDEWVQDGELSLQPSGQFTLAVGGALNCTRVGGQVQVIGWDYPGTYTVSGTTLRFVAASFTSTAVQFIGHIDPWQMRVRVSDLALHQSNLVDLEFHR